MSERPGRQLHEVHNDLVWQSDLFERLLGLNLISAFDLSLLWKARVDCDAVRMDELRLQLLEQAQCAFCNIELDQRMLFTLHGALSGDPRDVAQISAILIKEVQKKSDLEKAGETHVVSRGTVMAPSVINALATAMLQACRDCERSPPAELVDLISLQLGSDPNARRQEAYRLERFDALVYKAEDPEIGVRKLADKLGVSPTIVSIWFRDPDFKLEFERWRSMRSARTIPQ